MESLGVGVQSEGIVQESPASVEKHPYHVEKYLGERQPRWARNKAKSISFWRVDGGLVAHISEPINRLEFPERVSMGWTAPSHTPASY
jgi:hypothetical protein